MGVCTPILQKGNRTNYIVGVNASIQSERKPYLLYIMDVGSPIPFEDAESFSYMLYVVDVATPMPI